MPSGPRSVSPGEWIVAETSLPAELCRTVTGAPSPSTIGAEAGSCDWTALPIERVSVWTVTVDGSAGSADVEGARELRCEAVSGSGVDERLCALPGSSLRRPLIFERGEGRGTKSRWARSDAPPLSNAQGLGTARTWACTL